MYPAPLQTSANNTLTFGQPCGYAIHGNRVLINASRIANNRTFGNVSGTLAIQLWALKQPYTGGKLEGMLTASTTIGEIAGQYELTDCQYDLLFTQPDTGIWHLCLALAEWTGSDYAVVDAINFDLPYQVNWQPQIVAKEEDKVIAVDFTKTEKTSKANKAEPVKTETQVAEKPKAKVQPAKTKETAKAAMPTAGVSINKASVEDIARIKGLSKKVAKAIVDTRPYKSLDELIRVKGLGKKMLEKILPEVTL